MMSRRGGLPATLPVKQAPLEANPGPRSRPGRSAVPGHPGAIFRKDGHPQYFGCPKKGEGRLKNRDNRQDGSRDFADPLKKREAGGNIQDGSRDFTDAHKKGGRTRKIATTEADVYGSEIQELRLGPGNAPAAFPGQDEIKCGSRTFVRMADRSTFTEKRTGKAIGELPLADLMMINDFLNVREKS